MRILLADDHAVVRRAVKFMLAAAFKEDKLTRTGWRHVFPPDSLPPGRHTLRAFAYDAASGEATRLAGEFST